MFAVVGKKSKKLLQGPAFPFYSSLSLSLKLPHSRVDRVDEMMLFFVFFFFPVFFLHILLYNAPYFVLAKLSENPRSKFGSLILITRRRAYMHGTLYLELTAGPFKIFCINDINLTSSATRTLILLKMHPSILERLLGFK